MSLGTIAATTASAGSDTSSQPTAGPAESKNPNPLETTNSNLLHIMNLLQKHAQPLAEGAVVGTIGRALTMPHEWVFYKKSEKGCNIPLSTLYRQSITLNNLRHLSQIYVTSCLGQTALKSVANLGAIRWLQAHHPELTPLQRTLWLTALGTIPETIVTAGPEAEKVEKLRGIPPTKRSYFTRHYGNVFGATAGRVAGTTFNTYLAIFTATEQLKKYFPDNPILVKFLSGGLAGFAAQLPNTPYLNFQTWAVLHAHLPAREIVTSFVREHTYGELIKGWTARGFWRGSFWGISLGIDAAIDKIKKTDPEPNSRPALK